MPRGGDSAGGGPAYVAHGARQLGHILPAGASRSILPATISFVIASPVTVLVIELMGNTVSGVTGTRCSTIGLAEPLGIDHLVASLNGHGDARFAVGAACLRQEAVQSRFDRVGDRGVREQGHDDHQGKSMQHDGSDIKLRSTSKILIEVRHGSMQRRDLFGCARYCGSRRLGTMLGSACRPGACHAVRNRGVRWLSLLSASVAKKPAPRR